MMIRTTTKIKRNAAHIAYRKMVEFARLDRKMADKLRTSLDLMCLRIEKARDNDLQKAVRRLILNNNAEKTREHTNERIFKRLLTLMNKKNDRL